eukprot:GFUD01031061.1.p1 GENE.GFUD01031061.1~~GFUD01031061.1.p1  ORF type:complete len:334 (+),score=109.71 GFUD01031061.1:51-1004(+)
MEVQIIGEVGFVWDLEHVLVLRNKFRILGSFVGFSPKSVDIGLPLLLMGEEIQLLKEKGIVKLVEIKCWEEEPSERIIQRALDYKEQTYQSQIEEFKEERIEVINKMADKIVAGKKRKKLEQLKKKRKFDGMRLQTEKRRKLEGCEASDPQVVDLSSDEETEKSEELIKIDRNSVISQEIAKIKPISRDMQAVQMFDKDPWLENEDKISSNWTFKTEGIKKCKLFTFKDLWNNNYYISEGSKFGGDFLVYSGDPVKYHAKFIVICLNSVVEIENENRIQDLVARSRLGTCVKKTVLFSWLDGEDVKYRSLKRGDKIC